MADKYIIDGQTLSDIADQIRLKRDIATPIKPEDMPLEISLIEGGGGDSLFEPVWNTTITLESAFTGTSDTLIVQIPNSGAYEALGLGGNTVHDIWAYEVDFLDEMPLDQLASETFRKSFSLYRGHSYYQFNGGWLVAKNTSGNIHYSSVSNNWGFYPKSPILKTMLEIRGRCSGAYANKFLAGRYKITFYKCTNPDVFWRI